MLTLSPTRKNKVNLADYNSSQDIENRILMSDFSTLDIQVLEEILYSSLKISFKKLQRTLAVEPELLYESIQKLSRSQLLTHQDDAILVDKERRKYFEFQIQCFDPDFRPDMEFVQGILKKVPIQVLPTWYSIPRSSNNIFESIVERYLLTPQIFQRYLGELNFCDPLLNGIMEDLFSAPDFTLSSTDIISKYNLTRHEFEEALLVLEFNFVCCLGYKAQDGHFLEFVTPFHEWHEYLRFLKQTETATIVASEPIEREEVSDFAFLEQMSQYLLKAKEKPLKVEMTNAVQKLCLIKLAEVIDGKLYILPSAESWLDLSLENRALHMYRHPHNHILSLPVAERFVREAEKSIKRILHGKWVYFEDFLKGVLVPLSEHSVIALKRNGKHWQYTQPVYSEDDKKILKATVFEWLYETGMVKIGICRERPCFAMTHFGKFFFDD